MHKFILQLASQIKNALQFNLTEQSTRKYWVIELSDSYCALSDCVDTEAKLTVLCVWALREAVEQVPARWLFPLIIAWRCSPLVSALRNRIWQTSQCIAEMERDGVYTPQINPFVFPIVILSGLKMLPKLRQNACKTLNFLNKIEQ